MNTSNPFDFKRIRGEIRDIADAAAQRRRKGLRVIALSLLAALAAMLVAVAASIQTLPRAGLDYEGIKVLSERAAFEQLVADASRQ
ncbi:hypothetical protein HYS79_01230 [Patescibacteria group bacterium]|nr:hypothetical protein [Patescibacteria group bacterium]